MSDNDPNAEIDEGKREADEDLGDLDSTGDDMEERLAENKEMSDDIEVPEPGKGEDLSISKSPSSEEGPAAEAGASEDAVPEDEGEAASEAGQ